MAGHSKWANIQHRKGAQDAKRAKVFTRYIREITVAARMGGGDIDANPRLRAAVSAARAVNMPKDNIDRAIQRGAGGSEGSNIEEIRYEGYGQAGVAILVDCMTDNRNRTVSDVRSAFNKGGGNLGESGCVSWMFHQKGQFIFEPGVGEDAVMETALEAGAEDVELASDGSITVSCQPGDFLTLLDALEKADLNFSTSEVTWIPENTIEIEGESAEKLLNLIERLEDLDDVQNVYANFDISDAEMERMSG